MSDERKIKQLREALENIMLWWDGEEELNRQFIEARAALEATKNG